jgi:hypothetical protein
MVGNIQWKGVECVSVLEGRGVRLTRFEFKKQIGLTEELAVIKLHVK